MQKDNRLRMLCRKGVAFYQTAELIHATEEQVKNASRGNKELSPQSDELLESLVCVAEYLEKEDIQRHLKSDNPSLSGLFLDALEKKIGI